MAGEQIAPRAANELSQQELTKQIDQARVELGRTVDAIADKVKPANVARRTADQLRQRIQTVDPKLAGAGAAVVVGVVALIVWRRRRRLRLARTLDHDGPAPARGGRPIVMPAPGARAGCPGWGQSLSLVSSSYSVGDSSPDGSPSPPDSWTLNIQPAPYGSELTRPGSPSSSLLISVTWPSTGE